MSKTMAEPKKETKAQRATALRQQLADLEKEAADEALKEITAHLETLSELGKPHVVITLIEYDALKAGTTQKTLSAATGKRGRPSGGTNAPKATPSASSNFNAERYCKVCEVNGHDTKAHNRQDPKGKFTADE